MSEENSLESPTELGRRFARELEELVAHGEITAAFAERIRRDLFEPGAAGEPPKLNWPAWCAFVQEQEALAGVHNLRRS